MQGVGDTGKPVNKEDVTKESPSKTMLVLAPLLDRTEILLSVGGDDRLTLNAKLLNKYLSSTFPQPDVIRRGSCTCSTITTEVRPLDPSFGVEFHFQPK